MRMPSLTATRTLAPVGASRGAAAQAAEGVELAGCSALRWTACAVAGIACGASCLLGPEVCIPCLAAIGMPTCLDCLT